MKTVSSADVQNRVGAIANIVKGGEPVAVTQYWTRTLMILPYDVAAEALRNYNARKLAEFMNSMPAALPDAPSRGAPVQLTKLAHELRP